MKTTSKKMEIKISPRDVVTDIGKIIHMAKELDLGYDTCWVLGELICSTISGMAEVSEEQEEEPETTVIKGNL